jgi:prepilin-type N-terminal cleavage/methylation domain-containing protein
MQKNQKGFTLMELMVVIVIVAILAAVAVPLYINYVKDAQRTEAKGAIGAVITAQQAFYQKNENGGDNEYAGQAELTSGKLNVELIDVSHHWTITISGASTNGFVVRADGNADTPADGLWVQCIYSRTAAPQWSEG